MKFSTETITWFWGIFCVFILNDWIRSLAALRPFSKPIGCAAILRGCADRPLSEEFVIEYLDSDPSLDDQSVPETVARPNTFWKESRIGQIFASLSDVTIILMSPPESEQ